MARKHCFPKISSGEYFWYEMHSELHEYGGEYIDHTVVVFAYIIIINICKYVVIFAMDQVLFPESEISENAI